MHKSINPLTLTFLLLACYSISKASDKAMEIRISVTLDRITSDWLQDPSSATMDFCEKTNIPCTKGEPYIFVKYLARCKDNVSIQQEVIQYLNESLGSILTQIPLRLIFDKTKKTFIQQDAEIFSVQEKDSPVLKFFLGQDFSKDEMRRISLLVENFNNPKNIIDSNKGRPIIIIGVISLLFGYILYKYYNQ